MSDMVRTRPWPFPNGAFPPDLGAVVQRTVLDGELPTLMVAHAEDGSWMVADGVNDPNAPGAAVATHMHHVVARDPSIVQLASLPPGTRADRTAPGSSWTFSDFIYESDESA
jgi:hypothetical protein